jgi:hypothetical protein
MTNKTCFKTLVPFSLDNIKTDIREVEWGGGRHGLDRSGSGQLQVAGSCVCGNKPSGLIKCGEFLDLLRIC